MADDPQYVVRVKLEDELSNAMASMSRRTQDAFSAISAQLNATTKTAKSLQQEAKALDQVFNKTSYTGKTVGKSFSDLKNNIFTLRKSINEAKAASKGLGAALDQIRRKRVELAIAAKNEAKAGVGANQAIINSTKQSIAALREQEKQIRKVKNAFDTIGSNSVRLRLSTLNKDIGLVGKSMIDFGKNLNYVGRNLTFALGLPIFGFVRYGIDNLRKLDKEVIRSRKILNDAFATDAELDTFMNQLSGQLDNLSYLVTDSYKGLGIARELVQGLAADFAQLGVPPEQIFTLVRLSAELEKIGDVDITTSKEFITSAFQQAVRTQQQLAASAGEVIDTAEIADRAVNMITGSLYSLNAIENKTVLSLKGMADAFPEMQGIATTFGLTMLEAGAMFAPMIAAGFEVGASANSIKVSLQRIVAPTKQNKEIMAELGRVLGEEFTFKAGIGIETIQSLVDGFTALEKSSYGTQGALEFFARLFGVRQGPRMEQGIRQLAIFQQQLSLVGSSTEDIFSTIARNVNTELEKIGISDRFTLDTIQQIHDISQFAAKAQMDGNERVFEAVNKGQRDAVAELEKRYGNFFQFVNNEAGKVLLTQALGPDQLKEIYDRELEAANNTVEAKLGRSRELFKALSRDLVPLFVDLLENIREPLQKFVGWVGQLSPAAKKAIGAFLGLLALSGPLTTFVSILAQIGGVGLKLVTSILPRLFKVFRVPKDVGSGLTELAGGVGEITSRMTLFGRTMDRVSSRFPIFGNGLKAAFGGTQGFRKDIILLGNSVYQLGGSKGMFVRSLISPRLPTDSRSDLDLLAKNIVRQTTESVSRNRVKAGKGGPLSTMLGLSGFGKFFSKTVSDASASLNGLKNTVYAIGGAEDYVTQYVRAATAALGIQSTTSAKKGKVTTQTAASIKKLTKEELALAKVVATLNASTYVRPPKRKNIAPVAPTMAQLFPSGLPPFTKRRGTGAPVVLTSQGGGPIRPVPSRPVVPSNGINYNPVTGTFGPTLGKPMLALPPGPAVATQSVVKKALSEIEQLELFKQKLLKEIPALKRQGTTQIESRYNKLVGKAKSLGIPATNAQLQRILFDYVDEAQALIQKPEKAVKKTTETLKKKLTKQDILGAFDTYNKSKPDGVSTTTRMLQAEMAEAIGRNADKSASMLQQATYDQIISEIQSGKLLNVEEITKRTDKAGRLTKKSARYRDLFKQSTVSAKVRKSMLSKDDVVNAVLNTNMISRLDDLSKFNYFDHQVMRYVLRDIPDMREGTILNFESAVQRLLFQHKGDKLAQEKIRRSAKSILKKLTGQGYQTRILPERRSLIGLGESASDIAYIEKLEADLLRETMKYNQIEAKFKAADEQYRASKAIGDKSPRSRDLQRSLKHRLEAAANRKERIAAELSLYKKGAEKFIPAGMPIPSSIDDLMDIESGLAVMENPYDDRDKRKIRTLLPDTRENIKAARASRVLGGQQIRSLGKEMRKFPKGTKEKIDKIKNSLREKLQREASIAEAFKRKAYLSKFSGITDSFKKSFPLMSLAPMAALGPVLAGMSDAPGGLLGKIFGGAGAGAAMAAVGGGLGGESLDPTVLDTVLKRRGLKGAKLKSVKSTILKKLSEGGDVGAKYLEVLTTPITKLSDDFKDIFNQLAPQGKIGSTKGVGKILDKVRGQGKLAKAATKDVAEWSTKLIDNVLPFADDKDALGNEISRLLNKSSQQAVASAAANADDTVKKVAKGQGARAKAAVDLIKQDPVKAVNDRLQQSVEKMKRVSSRKVATLTSQTKAMLKFGEEFGIDKALINKALGDLVVEFNTMQQAVGRFTVEAVDESTGEVTKIIAMTKAASESAGATAKKSGAEAASKAVETVKVTATAVSKEVSDAVTDSAEAVRNIVVPALQFDPSVQATGYGLVAVEQIKAITGQAQTVVAVSTADAIVDASEATAATIVTITDPNATPEAPPVGISNRASRSMINKRRIAAQVVAQQSIDYVEDYHKAALAALALGVGTGMPTAGGASRGIAGAIRAGLGRTLLTPFTKVTNGANRLVTAFGSLSSVLTGFIPIFGKMASRGIVNAGRSGLRTTSYVRDTLSAKFIDNKQLSTTSKLIRNIGVDLVAASSGIIATLNPLRAVASIFKGITTAIKLAFMATGIGLLIGLLVAVGVAIKNSIENFGPIVEKLKEAWKNISEALTIIVKPILDMIMAFAGVTKSVRNTGDALEDSKGSAKGAIASITGLFVVLSRKFRDNADKIAKFVKDKVVPVFVQIIQILVLAGKMIISIFSGSFGKAGDAGDELWRRILYGFISIVKSVMPIVKQLLKVAMIAFAKLADFIVTTLISAAKVAFEWITENAGSLLVALAKGMAAAALGGTPGDIQAFWNDLTKDLKFWEIDIKTYVRPGAFDDSLKTPIEEQLKTALKDEDIDISDWLRSKIDFDQGWIEGLLDGLLDGVDFVFDGILGFIDNKLTEIADDFREKFGKSISDIPSYASPEDKEKVQKFIDDLVAEISISLPGAGEEIGQQVGGAIKDALKDIQQRFVDLITDYLGDQISKYKEKLTSLLEEQKEKQLAYFDDQIAALEALEKAEEELTATKEYETGRRRMIEDRDLQRANYQRNRALAIYEGRVDDARNLDLEEEKNTRDFRDNLDNYDKDRARDLQARQRETVKSILEQQKKDAEKAFDEIIKNYEKFIENIGKYGTYNQEELEKQFKELQMAAQGASIEMALSLEEYYRSLPGIISKYTDPTVGYFSEPLDKLIDIARSKFGLGADSGVSPDTILGNTELMLSGVTEKIKHYDHIMGGAFGSSLRTTIDDYIIPAMTEIDQVFEDFDPGQILKDAIDNANMVLAREQQKLIDGMGSLVKGMEDALDPAIAKWYALKAAIEAATGAASGSNGGNNSGGIPQPSDDMFGISQKLTQAVASAFNTGIGNFLNIDQKNYLKEFTTNSVIKALNTPGFYISHLSELRRNTSPIGKVALQLFEFVAKKMGMSGTGGVSGGQVRYNGGMIKKYGVGGYAVPGFGSTAVPAILHGGEYVINSKAVQNIGMATLQSLNNMRFASPGGMRSAQPTVINETKNVNIYVDNFIGQDQWFESMMKEYNIKVVPRNQKSAGLDVRKVSSYSGLNRGM